MRVNVSAECVEVSLVIAKTFFVRLQLEVSWQKSSRSFLCSDTRHRSRSFVANSKGSLYNSRSPVSQPLHNQDWLAVGDLRVSYSQIILYESEHEQNMIRFIYF